MMFTSKTFDEKRLYRFSRAEIAAGNAFERAGHTAAATRAMAYYSTGAAFNDKVGH